MKVGIEGLLKIIGWEMKELCGVWGDMFLLFGKKGESVKIVGWDGDGFVV